MQIPRFQMVIPSATVTPLSSSVPAVTEVPLPLPVAPSPLLLVMVRVPPLIVVAPL